MFTCRNKTRDMCHIYHKVCTDTLCDLRKSLEVDLSGVSACTGNNEFRLLFLCESLYLIVVEHSCLVIEAVRNEIKVFTGNIDGRTVREVSAVSEAHTENCIAGLKKCKIHCCICLCAGMGLNICEIRAEELLCTLDSYSLDYIDIFAAAIVTLSRISFGVFVGQHASHSSHNCGRNDVFARNKFEIALLTLELVRHSSS